MPNKDLDAEEISSGLNIENTVKVPPKDLDFEANLTDRCLNDQNSALDLDDPALDSDGQDKSAVLSQMSFVKLGLVTNLMALSFVALNGTSKELMANHSVDVVELCFIQNASCLVCTLLASALLGISLCGDVPVQTRPMLLASAVASAFCLVFTNLEVLTLPLMICQVFRALTPFAVVILGFLALGEQVTKSAIIAMVISFVGVVILSIAQPDKDNENPSLNYQPFSYSVGIGFALGAVVTCAALCITTRSMQKINFVLIIMSFNIVTMLGSGLVVGLKFYVYGIVPFQYFANEETLYVMGAMAVSNVFAQVLLYYSNQKAQPALVALLCTVSVVYNYFVDAYFFDLVPTMA